MPNLFTHDEELLTARQVAAMLGVSTATLKTWRRLGKAPAYVRLPSDRVRYQASVIAALMKGEKEPETA